jgi:hypothetical protein
VSILNSDSAAPGLQHLPHLIAAVPAILLVHRTSIKSPASTSSGVPGGDFDGTIDPVELAGRINPTLDGAARLGRKPEMAVLFVATAVGASTGPPPAAPTPASSAVIRAMRWRRSRT